MKIVVFLYPVLTLLILGLLFRLLHLRRYTKIRVTDIWTLFLIYGLNTFFQTATGSGLWAYYLLLASVLALVLIAIDVFLRETFNFKDFFKRWWRILYLMTLAMYLCLLVALLFLR